MYESKSLSRSTLDTFTLFLPLDPLPLNPPLPPLPLPNEDLLNVVMDALRVLLTNPPLPPPLPPNPPLRTRPLSAGGGSVERGAEPVRRSITVLNLLCAPRSVVATLLATRPLLKALELGRLRFVNLSFNVELTTATLLPLLDMNGPKVTVVQKRTLVEDGVGICK